MSDIHMEFKKELAQLLEKYQVEIEAKDYWTGYAECGQDVRITAMFDGIYLDGEIIRAYSELDLGQYLHKDYL